MDFEIFWFKQISNRALVTFFFFVSRCTYPLDTFKHCNKLLNTIDDDWLIDYWISFNVTAVRFPCNDDAECDPNAQCVQKDANPPTKRCTCREGFVEDDLFCSGNSSLNLISIQLFENRYTYDQGGSIFLQKYQSVKVLIAKSGTHSSEERRKWQITLRIDAWCFSYSFISIITYKENIKPLNTS